MRWISKLLNAIFKHLYAVCAGMFLFALAVLLVSMSAQYLGNIISDNILDNKKIEVLFINDGGSESSSNTDIRNLFDAITNNHNIKNHHIETKKIDLKKHFSVKKGARILISVDKNFIEHLSQERKLAILNESMFAQRTHKYIEFSKYNEYVLAETTVNHLKVYIAITNAETNTEQTKAFRAMNIISDNFIRKVDLQPDV